MRISNEASSLNRCPRIRSGLDGSSLKCRVYVGGDASVEILFYFHFMRSDGLGVNIF